jgi:rubrerythrin
MKKDIVNFLKIYKKQKCLQDETTVWECRNCGHRVVGEKAPGACAVCLHPQAYFEVVEENY